MREFALFLWQATVYSTVTAAALILIKKCLKFRISPALHTALWLILLIRLLFPILPESRYSVYNLFPSGQELLQGEILEEEYFGTQPTNTSESDYIENLLEKTQETVRVPNVGEFHIPAAEPSAEDEIRTDPVLLLTTMLVILYISGAVIALLILIISYILVRYRTLAVSLPCEDRDIQEMYLHALRKFRLNRDRAPALRIGTTSLLLGVFRPVIVLDSQAEEADIPMILVHELNHYVHHDNFLILLSNAAACLLWFNPLIWTARSYLRDDIEVLCDCRTLKYASVNQYRYASLLYRSADSSHREITCSTYMSAEGNLLKMRLRRIAQPGRHPLWERFLTGILCILIVVACLTNPVSSIHGDYSVYMENGSALAGNQYISAEPEDRISGIRFYSMIYSTLKNRTGGNRSKLVSLLGDGSLKSLTVTAEKAGVSIPNFKEYMSGVAAAQSITYEQAAVILYTVMNLVSTGDLDTPELPLPVQIREKTLVSVLQTLPRKEAKALLSCYNRGSVDTEIGYARCYTVETIVKIMSSIENEWLRMKFISYYYRVPLDQITEEQYASIHLETQYDYAYMLRPDTLEREERTVQDIVAITKAGIREDVFYLKPRQDIYSYEYIQLLYEKAGFDRSALHEEYAALGYSDYSAGDSSIGWYAYRRDAAVTNSSGQPEIDAAVRFVCQCGIASSDSGSFPYSNALRFGEAMHMLCLLYAGMVSQ